MRASLELEHVAWDGQVTTARKSIPRVGSPFEIRCRHWTLSEFRLLENLATVLEADREVPDAGGRYRNIFPYSLLVAVILVAPSGVATR
jgi:hypothetical protein